MAEEPDFGDSSDSDSEEGLIEEKKATKKKKPLKRKNPETAGSGGDSKKKSGPPKKKKKKKDKKKKKSGGFIDDAAEESGSEADDSDEEEEEDDNADYERDGFVVGEEVREGFLFVFFCVVACIWCISHLYMCNFSPPTPLFHNRMWMMRMMAHPKRRRIKVHLKIQMMKKTMMMM